MLAQSVSHSHAPADHGGHPTLTSSLLKGLREIGVNVRFNVDFGVTGESRVGCLADPQISRGLLQLRAKGEIERLVIGPNTHVSPLECGPTDLLRYADAILCPSQWVVDYQQKLVGATDLPFRIWAAGTDTSHWSPKKYDCANIVLIYDKQGSKDLVEEAMRGVESAGAKSILISYGSHTSLEYRALLDLVRAVVYVGGSESQGLAIQEAWSMDKPTFVYSPPGFFIHFPNSRPRLWLDESEMSPAPYLTPACGALWRTSSELSQLIAESESASYAPRHWVLANMTLEIAAQRYLDLFTSGESHSQDVETRLCP
jgi:hypothetical protein